MKIYFLFLLLSVILLNSWHQSEAQTSFANVYYISFSNTIGNSNLNPFKGNYLLVNTRWALYDTIGNAELDFIDLNGNLLYSKGFRGAGIQIEDVTTDENSGVNPSIILVGIQIPSPSSHLFFVAGTSDSGEIAFSKALEVGDAWNDFTDVEILNNKIYACGEIDYSVPAPQDFSHFFALAKFDLLGNPQWFKQFGNLNDSSYYSSSRMLIDKGHNLVTSGTYAAPPTASAPLELWVYSYASSILWVL